uniref:Uncharacterized protein n=1 Tax=Apteryx owenii TaxID=8824 RepID=A0A8B9NW46_APTOW
TLIFYKQLHELQGNKKMKEPPGPTPQLVFGSLPQLGEDPHITLTQLREKYRDIFQIRLRFVLVVVLRGIHTIKQTLVRQGEKIWRRLESPQEDCKKCPEKASNRGGQNSTRSRLLEEQVCFEALEPVRAFLDLSGKEDNSGPASAFAGCVANVICTLCFGKRYNQNDREFLTVVRVNLVVTQNTNPHCIRYFAGK